MDPEWHFHSGLLARTVAPTLWITEKRETARTLPTASSAIVGAKHRHGICFLRIRRNRAIRTFYADRYASRIVMPFPNPGGSRRFSNRAAGFVPPMRYSERFLDRVL